MKKNLALLEVGKVDSLLRKAGLADIVDTRVEVLENEYNQKRPHIVARFKETVRGVNDTRDGYVYYDKMSVRCEELNKYFSGKVFALGITQRGDWLKATYEEREAYLKGSEPFGHPAMYKK